MAERREHHDRQGYSARLGEAVACAVSETMELMCFLEVTQFDVGGAAELSGDYRWVSLLHHQPVQGEFHLAMDRVLIESVCRTLYARAGVEIDEQTMYDTMGELLNTIVGRLMNGFLGDDVVFQIGLPQAGTGALPPPEHASLRWNARTDEGAFAVIACGESLLQMRREHD